MELVELDSYSMFQGDCGRRDFRLKNGLLLFSVGGAKNKLHAEVFLDVKDLFARPVCS